MDFVELFQRVSRETEAAVIANDIAELKRIQRFIDDYEGELPDTGFEFFNCMLTSEQLAEVYGED
jgi:hypothetical protein